MRRIYIIGFLLILSGSSIAQLLGGSASFNFLRLSAGALTLAQGGSVQCADLNSLSYVQQNPSLLTPVNGVNLHSSVALLPGGVKSYFIAGSHSSATASWVTAAAVHFVDYGTVPAADAAGNVLGNFRASDWVMQLSASMPYLQRWRGGASLKYAHSSYGIYQSAAILADVGISYRDTLLGLEWGASLRNTGVFLRRYSVSSSSDLPMELSVGAIKKLKGSPFGLGLALQRMQQWRLDSDALYDPQYAPIGVDNRQSTFVGQFFNHLILSARVDVHPRILVMGGYNFLRRRELSWAGSSNGLTGFSLGLRVNLDRFQLHYGRAYYQAGQAVNQLSLELSLKPESKGWKR